MKVLAITRKKDKLQKVTSGFDSVDISQLGQNTKPHNSKRSLLIRTESIESLKIYRTEFVYISKHKKTRNEKTRNRQIKKCHIDKI